jgi:hypothetical protein
LVQGEIRTDGVCDHWDGKTVDKVGPKGYVHGWIKVGSNDDPSSHAGWTFAGHSGNRPISVNAHTGHVAFNDTGEHLANVRQMPSGNWSFRPDADDETAEYYSRPNIVVAAGFAAMAHESAKPASPHSIANADLAGKAPRGSLSADKLWASDQGTVKDITPAELKAGRAAWFRGGFGTTSDYLRSGKKVSESRKANVEQLKNLVGRAKLTKSIYVHRGMAGTTGMFGKPGSSLGKTFSDKNFTATSASSLTAHTYAVDNEESALVHITVPKGFSAFKPGPEFYKSAGDHTDQMEYLLPPGTEFKVTGDAMTSNMRHIYLTVVAQNAQ